MNPRCLLQQGDHICQSVHGGLKIRLESWPVQEAIASRKGILGHNIGGEARECGREDHRLFSGIIIQSVAKFLRGIADEWLELGNCLLGKITIERCSSEPVDMVIRSETAGLQRGRRAWLAQCMWAVARRFAPRPGYKVFS
jgi:hypothetical protein